MWENEDRMSRMQRMGMRPSNKWNAGASWNASNGENVANKDENERKQGGNVGIGVEIRYTMSGKG